MAASTPTLAMVAEAATRGVLRALEAQEDVSGYAQNLATQQPGLGGINLQPRPGRPIGPIIMGIWYNPTLPGPYAGQLGTSVKPV